MIPDERISEALRTNSQWQGSPDALWAKVSEQLRREPRRSRQPLWLGTAAAAVLILALFAQSLWKPQPPPLPDVEEPVPLRMFSVPVPLPEPQIVQGGAELKLVLTMEPGAAGEEEGPILEIWPEKEGASPAILELTARGAQLLQDGYLMVRAPEEPGSYLMVVRGTVRDRDQLYNIYAEERITVEAEKE